MIFFKEHWALLTYLTTTSAVAFQKGFYTQINLPTEIKITDAFAFFQERLIWNTKIFFGFEERLPFFYTIVLIVSIAAVHCLYEILVALSPKLPLSPKADIVNSFPEFRLELESVNFIKYSAKSILVLLIFALLCDLHRFTSLSILLVLFVGLTLAIYIVESPTEQLPKIFKNLMHTILLLLMPAVFYLFGTLHAKEMVQEKFSTFPPACVVSENTFKCGQLLNYTDSKTCLWRLADENVTCFSQPNSRTIIRDPIQL